jgi:signal transduction histidine kinase
MPQLAMLRQMLCILSCQQRDLLSQLPSALECLSKALNASAAGIYWRDDDGAWRLRAQHPAGLVIPDSVRNAVLSGAGLAEGGRNEAEVAWLAAPMRIGGAAVGRLWVIATPDRRFRPAEREFMTLAGNQLAFAIENAQLTDDVQHLADRRSELLRRVIATQDERCRRVSRELHDEISQSLTAMALDLEAMEIAGKVNDRTALARLQDLRTRLLGALDEVNRIILDLRPTLLEDLGLVPALRWYAAQRLGEGVRLHLAADGTAARFGPHIETTLYRITQEAITNVCKHASATNLWLEMRCLNGCIELTIRDDGQGFELGHLLANPDKRVGIGLFGMRERATLAGGEFQMRSTPGKGTEISVRVPVEKGGEDDADTRSTCG